MKDWHDDGDRRSDCSTYIEAALLGLVIFLMLASTAYALMFG
jgi:hypothetical protein